jgi:hypothetical protein
MNKPTIALLLGVLSFLLMMFIGEGLSSGLGETKGLGVTFAAMAVYFFVCQLLLSRGHPEALRTDWRVMLALGAIPLATVAIQALVEKREVLLSQGLGILLSTCVGVLGGAFAGSRMARK